MINGKKIDSLISELVARDFNREASDVKLLKEAMYPPLSKVFSPTPRQPRMFSPVQRGTAPVTNKNMEFAKPGESVTRLDPVTGIERVIKWKMEDPMPVEKKRELERKVDEGEVGIDWLQGAYDGVPEKQNKLFFGYLLGKEKKKTLKGRLAGISGELERRGYTLLVKKLKIATDEYNKEMQAQDEHHVIPSIENIYEKSKSPQEFENKVKKLVSVHDRITDIVKKFENEYKFKILNKAESGALSEDEAVRSTLNLVSKADAISDKTIDKVSK
jgi:hypothetical protein